MGKQSRNSSTKDNKDNKRYGRDGGKKQAPDRRNDRSERRSDRPNRFADREDRRSDRSVLRIDREDRRSVRADVRFNDDAERFESDKEYLAGRNPVMEALNSGREIERLFIAEGAEGSIAKHKAIAREKGIIVDIVERSRLDRMVPGEKHQGVVAEIAAYSYAALDDVFAKAASDRKSVV